MYSILDKMVCKPSRHLPVHATPGAHVKGSRQRTNLCDAGDGVGMTNDQAIGQYLFHLVGRCVDGDAHERPPAVRAMHDAEHVRGQLFAEVVALADAAREVGETLRLETAAQRFIAPGQSAAAAGDNKHVVMTLHSNNTPSCKQHFVCQYEKQDV